MRTFKLWIGITLVFILGILAGSLGMGMYIQQRFERFVFEEGRPPHPPHPPMMRLLMRRLDKELDLEAVQKDEIERIVKQTYEKVHAIMQEKHPQLQKLAQENLEKIKEKLTHEQKEKFDRLKLFERMKRRFQGKPPLRPGIDAKRPEEILSELKQSLQLTESQEEEIRPIIEESIKKQRKTVAAYRRQEHENRLTMRSDMEGLQKIVERQFEKILSNEQMNRFKAFQEDQRFMREIMRGPRRFGEPPME